MSKILIFGIDILIDCKNLSLDPCDPRIYKKVIVLIKNDMPWRNLIISVGGVITKEKLVNTTQHNTGQSYDSGVKLNFLTIDIYCLFIIFFMFGLFCIYLFTFWKYKMFYK